MVLTTAHLCKVLFPASCTQPANTFSAVCLLLACQCMLAARGQRSVMCDELSLVCVHVQNAKGHGHGHQVVRVTCVAFGYKCKASVAFALHA